MKNIDNTQNPNNWSVTMYFYALDWWKRNGTFNQELYEKFLAVRYNIKIKH